MRYPEECPVFMVTLDGTHVRGGAIVEGLGPATHQPWGSARAVDREYDSFVSVRLLDEADWWCLDVRYTAACRTFAGFLGCCVGRDDLRPLTRAARAISLCSRS